MSFINIDQIEEMTCFSDFSSFVSLALFVQNSYIISYIRRSGGPTVGPDGSLDPPTFKIKLLLFTYF